MVDRSVRELPRCARRRNAATIRLQIIPTNAEEGNHRVPPRAANDLPRKSCESMNINTAAFRSVSSVAGILIFVALLSGSALAQIQITDIDKAVLARVSAKFPNKAVAVQVTGIGLSGDLKLDPAQTDPSSIAILSDTERFYNCSSIGQEETITASVKTTIGTDVTLTNGVTQKTSNTMKFDFAPLKAFGCGFSQGSEFSVSTDKKDAFSKTEEHTVSDSSKRTIPPATYFAMTVSVKRHTSIANFAATVNAVGTGTWYSVNIIQQCEGPKIGGVCVGHEVSVPIPVAHPFNIVDVLPPTDRTFQIAGVITDMDVRESQTAFASEPITDITKVKCNIPP